MISRSKMEEVRSQEIVIEGVKQRNPSKGFLSIMVTFFVEGDMAGKNMLHAIAVSGEKYCPVTHSFKKDNRCRLMLNCKKAVADYELTQNSDVNFSIL